MEGDSVCCELRAQAHSQPLRDCSHGYQVEGDGVISVYKKNLNYLQMCAGNQVDILVPLLRERP